VVTAAAMVIAAAAPASAGHPAHIRWQHHQPLPDRSATPGRAFRHAGPSRFCHSGYTAKVRHVSDSTRHRVFAEYGISSSRHRRYEVDHLIPLELGGSNSIKNLWPEPGPIPNKKDGVENKLHDLVCEHKLGLHTARRVMSRNWVSALHRYGSTGYVYDWPGSGGGGGGGGSGGGQHHSCTRTSSGSCIRGGEFCPAADAGQYGWDAKGHKYICRHGHWETP
jgi:hypothetical protein